jgi:hypothetical protein
VKWLLALLAATLLSLGACACGGTGGATSSRAAASALADASGATAHFRGDGDDDDEAGQRTGNPNDHDADFDYDTGTASQSYEDRDDRGVFAFGQPASAADERAIAALVKRYFKAAAAVNGARACTMIVARRVKYIGGEDYNNPEGEPYLRGAKNCVSVMSRAFEHFHVEVSAPFAVTGVRVKGSEALALMGSRTQPASSISLEREGSVWKVEGLLSQPLP